MSIAMNDVRAEVDALRDLLTRVAYCDEAYELERLFRQAIAVFNAYCESVADPHARALLDQRASSMRYALTREGGAMIRSLQNAGKSRATISTKDRASERFVQARTIMVQEIRGAIFFIEDKG
jgi:hypothetical protein